MYCKNRIVCWLGVLLLVLCHSAAVSQELIMPNYKQYATQDGLPQLQITALIQDSRGYIWAGTKDGIARFNGEKFVAPSAAKPAIEKEVTSINEDKQGRIWAVTPQEISCISGDSVKLYSLHNFAFSHSDHSAGDTIWFLGYDYKKNKQNIGYFTNEKFHFIPQLTAFCHRQRTVIYTLSYDPMRRALFIQSHDGIYLFSPAGGAVKLPENKYSLDKNYLLKFHIIDNQTFCIYKKRNTDEFHILYLNKKDSLQLLSSHINGKWVKPLPKPLSGKLSIAFMGQSHYIVKGKVKTVDISEHFVTTMLIDNESNTWFGTERGVVRAFSAAFTHYHPALLPEVWSVIEEPKGKYWLSSYSFGLKTLQNNKINVESGNQKRDYYFHSSKNDEGDIYFPHNTGISKRGANGKIVELPLPDKLLTYSLCSYYDKARNLILGGFRHNVVVWDRNDKPVRTIGQLAGDSVAGNVLCITRDSSKNYWFCGKEAYYYRWEQKKIKRYGDLGAGIWFLDASTDTFSRTWFATSKGLMYYDKPSDTLKKIEHPALQSYVNLVLPIDNCRLLVSQNNGLYIMDIAEFNRSGKVLLDFYNSNNGYFGDDPGQAGAYKDSEGNIWITSSTMLCKLNPHLLPKCHLPRANIVFTRYNNKPILYNEGKITLSPNQNSATIVFDAITLDRSFPLKYSYRTSKMAMWSVPQSENYIVLNNLRHGTTIVYVKPIFEGCDTLEGKNEYALTIHVNMAFYNQAWFIPTIAIFILFTIISLIIIHANTRIHLQNMTMRAKFSEIETIQAQMNPHFVYNVHANVQSKIREAKTEEAENILLKLANLTRMFLHTSTETIASDKEQPSINEHIVSLTSELGMLKQFIDFQSVLYPNTFVYKLSVDNDLDLDDIKIPPMLLQPFVENAITHGLIPKGSIGTLSITIGKDDTGRKTKIQITDNGIGMEESKTIQSKSKLKYKSKGRSLTLKRIKLLNELGFDIGFDTQTSEKGTIITIIF